MAGLVEVHLRRMDTSQPWGFRMRGGAQQGMPLFVEHVGPKSRAGSAGVQAGDLLVEICKSPMAGKTHDDAKREILRAGNELDLILERRGGVQAATTQAHGTPSDAPASTGEGQRSEVVEEPTIKFGGPTYKNVQPKTYQILQEELDSGHVHIGAPRGPDSQGPALHGPAPAPNPGVSAVGGPPAAQGPRPASIFNRNKAERSDYLKAKGSTIQKVYGQK